MDRDPAAAAPSDDPATQSHRPHVKEEIDTGNRSEWKAEGSRSENKIKTDLLVAFWGDLQVTTLLTADWRVKREGSHHGSPSTSLDFTTPRAATVPTLKTLLNTVPETPEVRLPLF